MRGILKMARWYLAVYGLLVVMMLAGLSRSTASSEQPVHFERGEAVVTLVDADRSDPSLFRWVLVVSLDGAWSTLLDRETGRVLQCVGHARTHEIMYLDGVPKLKLGECAEVWAGVVLPKAKK